MTYEGNNCWCVSIQFMLQVLLIIHQLELVCNLIYYKSSKSDISFFRKNPEICIQIDVHKEIDNIEMTMNISNVQKPIDSNWKDWFCQQYKVF